MRIDPEDVALIRTTIAIDPALVIRKDAVATLQSNLLSGVSFVQIRGGTQDAPPLEARGKQRYPVIPSVPSTLASVAESGPELLKKLNDTVDRFSLLLDEKNRQALGESLENLRVFTAGPGGRATRTSRELAGNANSATAAASKLFVSIEHSYTGPDGHRHPPDHGDHRFRQGRQEPRGYQQAAARHAAGRSARAAQLQPANPDRCRQPGRRGHGSWWPAPTASSRPSNATR